VTQHQQLDIPSGPSRGDSGQVRQAEPETRGRGRRRLCRPSSQLSPRGEATRIIAPFTRRPQACLYPPALSGQPFLVTHARANSRSRRHMQGDPP
jgi:hypothetical protein